MEHSLLVLSVKGVSIRKAGKGVLLQEVPVGNEAVG